MFTIHWTVASQPVKSYLKLPWLCRPVLHSYEVLTRNIDTVKWWNTQGVIDSQMNKGSAPLCLLEIKGVLKLKKKKPSGIWVTDPKTKYAILPACSHALWPLQEIPRPLCCLSTIIFVPLMIVFNKHLFHQFSSILVYLYIHPTTTTQWTWFWNADVIAFFCYFHMHCLPACNPVPMWLVIRATYSCIELCEIVLSCSN